MTDWGDIFSKLSYWYGLQYSEIRDMPMEMLKGYMERLETRKTEERLMMADVVSLPHMKKRDRERTVNDWMRLLSIQNQVKPRRASPARLKMMGIGVKHV